jgi:hypothetical protein
MSTGGVGYTHRHNYRSGNVQIITVSRGSTPRWCYFLFSPKKELFIGLDKPEILSWAAPGMYGTPTDIIMNQKICIL